MAYKNNFDTTPGLPKWPQMLTYGVPVTQEQANEIIRRTDGFFVGTNGNDRAYNNRLRDAFNMGPEWCPEGVDFNEFWNQREAWLEQWGYIETQYVHNTWISSCYVGGPYGWCNPDGKILYTANIGKWPQITDVAEDWAKLAQAFPFLDIVSVLMGEEESEETTTPIAVFRIKNGEVSVGPYTDDPFVELDTTIDEIRGEKPDIMERLLKGMVAGTYNHEHGISDEVIEQWVKDMKERQKATQEG